MQMYVTIYPAYVLYSNGIENWIKGTHGKMFELKYEQNSLLLNCFRLTLPQDERSPAQHSGRW